MKQCSRCKRIFQARPKYFYRDYSKRDGLRHLCKGCDHKQRRVNSQRQKENLWMTHKIREKMGRVIMLVANVWCAGMTDDSKFVVKIDKQGSHEFIIEGKMKGEE